MDMTYERLGSLEAWEPLGARKQDSGGLHLRHGLFGLPTARGVIQ
jgi:hypothetical protein